MSLSTPFSIAYTGCGEIVKEISRKICETQGEEIGWKSDFSKYFDSVVDGLTNGGVFHFDGTRFDLMLEFLDAGRAERNHIAFDGIAEELEPPCVSEVFNLLGIELHISFGHLFFQ